MARVRMFNDESKHCSKCKQWLPLDVFMSNRSRVSGRSDYCIPCTKTYRNLRSPAYNRKHKYNMTAIEFAALVEKQKGKCVICEEVKKLVVDHDHKTGRVRGLLCVPCNSMLGNDDPAKFERAIQYLKADYAL